MTDQELITKFKGTLLDNEPLSSYQKWALEFFHDRNYIHNPNLEITVQLDITKSEKRYRKDFAQAAGASFTAYLYWSLIRTLPFFPCFSWRHIGGKWYFLENLPIFSPVAIGGAERFHEILLENVWDMSWELFCRAYRSAIDNALSENPEYAPITHEVHLNAFFFGNLPNLQFSGFSIHTSAFQAGRPIFYFGKRYSMGEKLYSPLYVQFDHANLDPFILNQLLVKYKEILEGCPADNVK